MAIEIRKLEGPTITLVGNRIRGGIEIGNDIITNTKDGLVVVSGLTVTKDIIYNFNNRVTVTLNSNYDTYTYDNNFNKLQDVSKDNKIFQGSLRGYDDTSGIKEINKKAEIYYTINGKNPTVTTGYLWTGESVTFNQNYTGDMINLKAKMYYQGQESKVTNIRFKIVQIVPNNFV